MNKSELKVCPRIFELSKCVNSEEFIILRGWAINASSPANSLTIFSAAQRRCRFGWGEVSFAELLLYNMRHVQGHAAQLNLLLGQKMGSAPDWVTQAENTTS